MKKQILKLWYRLGVLFTSGEGLRSILLFLEKSLIWFCHIKKNAVRTHFPAVAVMFKGWGASANNLSLQKSPSEGGQGCLFSGPWNQWKPPVEGQSRGPLTGDSEAAGVPRASFRVPSMVPHKVAPRRLSFGLLSDGVTTGWTWG